MRQVAIRHLLRHDGRCCRVVDGVFLGSVGAAYSAESLRACGIRRVLCVGTALDMPFAPSRGAEYACSYVAVPVRDLPGDAQKLMGWLHGALRAIEAAAAAGESILVHCFKGQSRSVTVVAAHLMASGAADTVPEAMDIIRRARPRASPNLGFALALRRLSAIPPAERRGAIERMHDPT